jgi:hypothetical protein
MQNIGEGTLEIPVEWHNNTINIFTEHPPGVKGISITVNRDTLPPGKRFEDYADDQALKLPRQLTRFHLIGTESIAVDGRAARLFEFTWHAGEAGLVHQVLLVVADGARVLSLAASGGGRMSEGQLIETNGILRNFRFSRRAMAGQE